MALNPISRSQNTNKACICIVYNDSQYVILNPPVLCPPSLSLIPWFLTIYFTLISGIEHTRFYAPAYLNLIPLSLYVPSKRFQLLAYLPSPFFSYLPILTLQYQLLTINITITPRRIPWVEQGTYCATYSCSTDWTISTT
jgi:hypothetical protein